MIGFLPKEGGRKAEGFIRKPHVGSRNWIWGYIEMGDPQVTMGFNTRTL